MLSVFWSAIATELAALNAYVVPLEGAEHLARNDPGPKMVFVELDDQIGPPEGPGGNPRPLFTIVERTELVLVGPTRDIVQGMRDQFLIALHKAAKKSSPATARAGRYTYSPGKWTRGTIIGRNGFEYRLVFGLNYPVVDRVWESSATIPGPDADATTYATQAGGTVTAGGGVGISADDVLVDAGPPVLTSSSPSSVATAGGETVTLTGTRLAHASELLVDEVAVDIESNSATAITFTMPATSAGDHAVTVTTQAGTSNALTIASS